MKHAPDPDCQLCSPCTTGTFIDMIPPILSFWKIVVRRLSVLLDVSILCSPVTLLLNDFSGLSLSMRKCRCLLLGLTAAKKMTAQRWKASHTLSYGHWPCYSLVQFCLGRNCGPILCSLIFDKSRHFFLIFSFGGVTCGGFWSEDVRGMYIWILIIVVYLFLLFVCLLCLSLLLFCFVFLCFFAT